MRELVSKSLAVTNSPFDRAEFGPGFAGQSAFNLIKNRVKCEAVGGCDRLARNTLDFDVRGDLVQIPVCSAEHYTQVLAEVAKDLAKGLNDPTFGMNGFGRS